MLIQGGRVIDPAAGREALLDLRIEGGRIAALAPHLNPLPGEEVFEARGLLVTPGWIDMHVHLREPGYEHRETIATGTRAAVHGGFTAVACMPNTQPPLDTPAAVNHVRRKAAEEGACRVYPIGCITKESAGQELAEIGLLREAGVVAISDDGRPVMNAHLMRQALEYTKIFDLLVISHCEDLNLAAGGVMHEGVNSTRWGLRGLSPLAEEVMVARDLELAARTGGRLHIAHVSTARSVELIRRAKADGVRVTAEVTPHHFTLTDAAVEGYRTEAKVNPPLRTWEDVAAVREGLRDGTIDVIATDHAPYTLEEKLVEFDQAPFGIVGLETALGLIATELVQTGVLSWPEAVTKVTLNPARILGIPGGRLAVGEPADLTIFDPARAWRVDPVSFLSKGRNTPFAGRDLVGVTVAVMVDGTWRFYQGRVVDHAR